MSDKRPKVVSRGDLVTTPWVTLVRKDVASNGLTEDFYSLSLPDYIAVVAIRPDGRIALVRQYRPAVEEFTVELPAGTLEAGETPEQCAVRELREETGLGSLTVTSLGAFYPDTGRLSNQQHIFLIECEQEPEANFVDEPGLEVSFATPAEVETMIRQRRFNHLLHISALYLAGILPSQALTKETRL